MLGDLVKESGFFSFSQNVSDTLSSTSVSKRIKFGLIDLEEETLRTFETLVTAYQWTRRHIPNVGNGLPVDAA